MDTQSTWYRARRIVRTQRYVLAFLIAAVTVTVVITATSWAQDKDLQPIAKELTTITDDLRRTTDKLKRFIEVLGTAPTPTGGPVSGSLYYQPPVKEFEIAKRIFLPDIEIFLHNTASGADSPTVITDFFGRYRFPYQAPGTYELRWKAQRGWAAGNHPDWIVIGSGPRFPVSARIQPDQRSGVIFGKVTLGDGGTPWSYDELFDVNHTATVTILNAARTATLAGPLHTNSEGGYAAAGLPRSQPATIQVSSQASIVTRTVDATRVSMGNPVSSTDVQLANKPPEIISVTPKIGGALVRTAAPGDTISLVADTRDLNGDPLQHEWTTLAGNGTVTPAAVGSANWKLPNLVGRFSSYLQVGDGRGGFARQRIDFITARTDTIFSGLVVEKGTGAPVKGADVVANGQTTTTDVNGFFSVKTPLKDRYVLNIERAGFALFSRVVNSGLTGQTWPLVRAQSETVDPQGPIDLVDERPELDRKKLKGTRIHVPANALVGPTGAAPTGKLTAHLATLNISEGEAPGDWGAMLGSKETNLISYGATFVEFRDAAGVKYNLAPGMEAGVQMFAPLGMLAGAPANSKFWSYDEADGFWKESGGANLSTSSGSFDGKVKHFSTINTDLEKDQAACLKALIYPPVPTGVKLRVTDPTGSVFGQAFEFVLDAGINAVYRLPANTNVRLELFNANGTPYGSTVLLEEVPGVPLVGNIVGTGPPIPAGQTLWPPEPYEPCKLVILREANAPTANAFLVFKGKGDLAQANGYYSAVDPNSERTTLGAWWTKNGFVFDANGIPTNAVRTSYLNFNDLGSGRDMYFLQRGDGTVAAYVTNYGLFNQDHGNADLAANRNTPGATVAMEYGPVEGQGPTRIVKFFVYAGADFASNAPRAAAADLDGFEPKFVPNLCLNCHGGNYYPGNPASPTFADVNMGAAFRELDIATYKFPGGRLVANTTEKTAFRQQNLIVKGAAAGDTITIQPIKDLIAGWYPGASIEQDNTFTPTGWVGVPQQDLYRDVVKQSCRTCHVAQDADTSNNGIGWITYGQLQQRRNLLDSFVLCDQRFMPHAVITYRNFWLSAAPHRPAVLRDFTNGSGWPALGTCS
jgi:hypothetical protein